MESNAGWSRCRPKALMILVAATGIVACNGGKSPTVDTTGTATPGGSSDPAAQVATVSTGGGGESGLAAQVASLRKEVDTLKAYRVRNAKFVADLWSSYSHFYYCDTGPHQDPKVCPPQPNHIKPPPPPPAQ